jgi:hypothetical protein
MLATVLADYPLESSRGKLTGIAFFLNALGSVVFLVGLTQLPRVYAASGVSELQSGRYAFFTVAAVAVLAAIVMLGLKPGLPAKASGHRSLRQIAAEGLRAARNPRVLLAYGGGFTSRADLSLITLFLALWASQSAIGEGLTAAQATGRRDDPARPGNAAGVAWRGLRAAGLLRWTRHSRDIMGRWPLV